MYRCPVLGFTRGRVIESFGVRFTKRFDRLFDDVPMQSGFSQQPLGEWKGRKRWRPRIGGDFTPLIESVLPFKDPTRGIAPDQPERESVVINSD